MDRDSGLHTQRTLCFVRVENKDSVCLIREKSEMHQQRNCGFAMASLREEPVACKIVGSA